MNLIKGYKARLFIAFGVSGLLLLLFLFIGVNQSNIGFFLPRRITKGAAFILVSFATAYSTTSFQTITNNHILTPSVMGLDSLYMFIQTIIVFFLGSKTLTMMTSISNYFISIGIMVGSSLILFSLLFKKEGKSLYFLLLTGMVFGSFFSGLSTFMQVMLDPNEFTLLQGKMFASFSAINNDLLLISVIIVAVIFITVIIDMGKLDVLSLGKEQAINLGINYKRLVLKNLIIIAILVSVITALVGPIAFLGIIVASLSRYLFASYKHSVRILGGTFICFIFITLAVLIVERLMNNATTISVIINFIGGIYFIFLILKEGKK